MNNQKTETTGLKIKRLLRLDRALRFVWQAGPGWTISSLALVVLRGMMPLLTLYLMKLIVDEVVLAMGAADKAAVFRDVGVFIILAGAVALLNALLQLIGNYVKEAQSLKVTDHMYDILHNKSIEVDLAYYENPHYLDTLHRAHQEGPYRPTHILDGLMQVGQSGVSLLAMAGLLFSFHWGIALVLFAAAIPGVLVRLRYSKKMYLWQRRRTPVERKAIYYNWILSGYEHAKETRLFDLGSLFTRRFQGLRKELRRERLEIVKRRSAADLVAQAGGIIAIFSAFGFIAYRTVAGTISIGDMVMYFQAFQRGLDFLRQVLGSMASLYEDNLFLSNLFEFLDLKPMVKDPLHPRPVPRPMQEGIVFDRVRFHYPTDKRDVLKDISFAIKPGEIVALVGANGSGKTTLIKLLCRLYDPVAGTIAFDGIDTRSFKIRELRHEISVIFQDFVHYHLTARENIWFGNIDLPPEHENIVAAARHSETHDLINGLPKGYETILGKWFEDGEELSIGEWQKVALARAFLRESQIIVLDEPTSAMDAKSEYEVFKRIRRLLKGRTAILISHRFSTVRMADRIIAFENGCISESGTHEQLMQNKGKYAYLFEKQAQHYR